MTDNQEQLQEVEVVIQETNAISIMDPVKESLVRDLQPIALRIRQYGDLVKMEVKTADKAKEAADFCDAIAADVKLIKGQEVLSGVIDGLHKLHRRWTGIRAMFLEPMEESRRQLKTKIIAWEESERAKAEAEQRRLQAEADAKARKEREKLEAKAATMKTEEKQQEYQEAAAAVIAPTVKVEVAKSGLRTRSKWIVDKLDVSELLAAAASDPQLIGYIEVKKTALERAKAANTMLTVPGVTFRQVRV